MFLVEAIHLPRGSDRLGGRAAAVQLTGRAGPAVGGKKGNELWNWGAGEVCSLPPPWGSWGKYCSSHQVGMRQASPYGAPCTRGPA